MKRVVSFTINILSLLKSIWGSSIKAHCLTTTVRVTGYYGVSKCSVLSATALSHLISSWALLLQIKMFTSDLVLSKIKIPSQKLGKRKESSKQLLLRHWLQFYISFFHSYFLNLWLLALGRKHMTWFRGHTRNSTRDWIQPERDIGLSILEQGPEHCEDRRRGKWFRRWLVNLQAAGTPL